MHEQGRGAEGERERESFFLKIFFKVSFEREGAWGKGRERGRERIPSRLHNDSTEPEAGLDTTNQEIMTWAEKKTCSTN